MIAASYLCLLIGAWSLWARMTGLCCGCLFGCVNLGALITTAVFRFNTWGKLAALSLCPTAYSSTIDPSTGLYLSYDRTYADDAQMVMLIFVFQMIVCLLSCCLNGVFNKPGQPQHFETPSHHEHLTHH